MWKYGYPFPPIIYKDSYHKCTLNYSDDEIKRVSEKCNKPYNNYDKPLNRYKINTNTNTEDIENSSHNKTIKEATGVLMHMLQSFGINDKEQIRKVVHYVTSSNKPYNVRANSNDTIYSYLHDESKLLNVYEKIKETLHKYDIQIPDDM